MKVFKFGGASVKDAAAVQNVVKILERFKNDKLVVVVSAMGKTTNALEEVIDSYYNQDGLTLEKILAVNEFHQIIITDLLGNQNSELSTLIANEFDTLSKKCAIAPSDNYHFEYDQIISYGEIVSTKIINYYLNKSDFSSSWLDARKLVRTNDKWREAKVDWNETESIVNNQLDSAFWEANQIGITQGFIAHTESGLTTTLGREGSDFTAAIFAYVLNAEDVTIWKDVAGMLNADPKYFDNTVLLEKISFREAIELAYFGASVIHPRTIQPLKRKNIPLYIKSFLDSNSKGTVIQSSEEFDERIPSFIFKMNQVLISLSPKDFSFVIEENLEEIFSYLNRTNVRMNIMQNSAVSFSFCVDQSKVNLDALISHFQEDYIVKYNENLELVTIRHYDDPTLARVTTEKEVILEQKSRETARLVMSEVK